MTQKPRQQDFSISMLGGMRGTRSRFVNMQFFNQLVKCSKMLDDIVLNLFMLNENGYVY